MIHSFQPSRRGLKIVLGSGGRRRVSAASTCGVTMTTCRPDPSQPPWIRRLDGVLPPAGQRQRGRSSAFRWSPRCYRVSMFLKSETLPCWFWECWYCLCCCCGCCCCCCCASGSCCVCGCCCCCWMYPMVLCCGTLVVCRKAGADPPCTSPWVICGNKKVWKMSEIEPFMEM